MSACGFLSWWLSRSELQRSIHWLCPHLPRCFFRNEDINFTEAFGDTPSRVNVFTHSVLEMIICSLRAFSYQVSGGIVSVLLLLLCFCCQGSFCSFTYGKQMRCDSLSLSEVTSYRCLKLVVVSSLNFGLHCLPRLLLLLLLRWCVRIQENVQKYR